MDPSRQPPPTRLLAMDLCWLPARSRDSGGCSSKSPGTPPLLTAGIPIPACVLQRGGMCAATRRPASCLLPAVVMLHVWAPVFMQVLLHCLTLPASLVVRHDAATTSLEHPLLPFNFFFLLLSELIWAQRCSSLGVSVMCSSSSWARRGAGA
ncbi:hypothetical protein VPH35_137495 [Triticum aestivum]